MFSIRASADHNHFRGPTFELTPSLKSLLGDFNCFLVPKLRMLVLWWAETFILTTSIIFLHVLAILNGVRYSLKCLYTDLSQNYTLHSFLSLLRNWCLSCRGRGRASPGGWHALSGACILFSIGLCSLHLESLFRTCRNFLGTGFTSWFLLARWSSRFFFRYLASGLLFGWRFFCNFWFWILMSFVFAGRWPSRGSFTHVWMQRGLLFFWDPDSLTWRLWGGSWRHWWMPWWLGWW